MKESLPNNLPNNLIYPKESFEDFYFRFKTPREMITHDDWKGIYANFYNLENCELDIPIGETTNDLNSFSAEEQIQEVIKCAKNFFYFCHRYVKILHPKFGTIPFIPYKYQRRTINCFDNHRFNMISKFRQGGLTTVTVLWCLWKCMYQKDQQIFVLSKTDREALAAGEIAKRAMDNFPYWMYDSSKADLTKHEKKFDDLGSKICFYTPEAARGKSATYIVIDEAAFIEKMEDHWKSMYPVIATGGHIEIISTVNGLGNWYEETYHEAEAGRNFFNIIDLDYWEHPTYANPSWAKEMKANLGEKGWQQEVLRSFLGSGETYISPEAVSKLDQLTKYNNPLRSTFEKWTNEDQIKNDEVDGALWIWKEPVDGNEYIIGADCAEGVGSEGDNSCFQIIDAINLEQVAEFYSNLVPPNMFAQILNQIGVYYNSATVIIENNSIGGAVLNSLCNDLAYESIFYEYKKTTAGKPGIKVTSANRSIILETLQHKIMQGSIKINSKRFVNELKTFIFNAQRKRAEAVKGKHDDAVMALCFALYARDERMRGLPVGGETEGVITIGGGSLEEIKNEILEGGVEGWSFNKDEKPKSNFDLDFKRPKDDVLKEFGW